MKMIMLHNPDRFQRLLAAAAIVHDAVEHATEGPVADLHVLLPGLALLRVTFFEMEEMIYTAAGDPHTVPVIQARTALLDWMKDQDSSSEWRQGIVLIDALIDACYLRTQRLSDERLIELTDDDEPPMQAFTPGDRNVH